MLIICLFVDDLIFIGDFYIKDFRRVMERKFEMSDLGLQRKFLGLEITQDFDGTMVNQSKYIADLLIKFNMSDCKC